MSRTLSATGSSSTKIAVKLLTARPEPDKK
jgi:hypothetical protein